MNRRIALAVFLFSCAASIACAASGCDPSTTAPASGASLADADADTTTDADTTADAGCQESDAAVGIGTGYVALTQRNYFNGTFNSGIAAQFYKEPPTLHPCCGDASVTTVGTCTVTETRIGDAGGPVGSRGIVASAGAVTVTTPRAAHDGITLLPPLYRLTASDGGAPTNPGQLFAGGDAIRVTGAGAPDGVPAFCEKTLAAPADIATTNPPLTWSQPASVSLAQDFVLGFSPAGPGEVEVYVDTTDELRGWATSVVCKGPASTGTITVPKEVLARLRLPQTNNGYNGVVFIYPSNAMTFTAGAYTIVLSAVATEASGPVLLQ